MPAITKPALATLTGAVALTLLLAGCTGSGDSNDASDDTSASQGAPATATDDAATAERTGQIALPADCDGAASTLGDLVAGMTLDESSAQISADEVSCSWTNVADKSQVAFFGQLKDYTAAEIEAEAADTATSTDGVTFEPIDDERVEAFGGRAFVGTTTSEAAMQGGGTVVYSTHGTIGLIVAAASAAGVPADDGQTLDAALEFVD